VTTATKLGALLDGKSAYERWLDEQEVPVVKGHYIPDLTEMTLGSWERKGGKGVIINLEGTGDTDDAYICEIAPGGKLSPERHMFEEVVYILEGHGATTIWQEGGPEQTFEWQHGSLFAIPFNSCFQHFNGSGNQPARYLAVTSAPLMMTRNLSSIVHICSALALMERPTILAVRAQSTPKKFGIPTSSPTFMT